MDTGLVDNCLKDGSGCVVHVCMLICWQVLVLGIDKSIEREGTDRTDTALPALQETFAHQILALNKPTILVLTNGGALAIDSLASARHPSHDTAASRAAPYAIVEAFNPAMYGGKAIGDALFAKPWANKWYVLKHVICRDALQIVNYAPMDGRGTKIYDPDRGKLPITVYPHEYIQQQPLTNYDMSVAPGRTYRYYQGKPLL